MSETLKKLEKLKIFLVAMITTVFCFGSYHLLAAEDDENVEDGTDSTENSTFARIKNDYHQKMNDLFNKKFEELAVILEADNFESDKNFNPPSRIEEPFLDPAEDSLEVIVQKCGKKNVSTYCVSMESLALYSAYVQELQYLKLGVLEYQGESEISGILSSTNSRNREIDQEIEDARLVMESALSAYNEFRLAYPMHQKYQEIINNLNIYRLNLKDIRERVVGFPSKFVDATTIYCE